MTRTRGWIACQSTYMTAARRMIEDGRVEEAMHVYGTGWLMGEEPIADCVGVVGVSVEDRGDEITWYVTTDDEAVR